VNARNILEIRSCLEASLLARADEYIRTRFEHKCITEPLSIRESTILKMLAKGLTAEEIATLTDCGVSTTRSHLQRIYAKFGVRSSIHAIVIGKRLGLLID
jgi:DNA-binding CsgD family transcriptional regulator